MPPLRKAAPVVVIAFGIAGIAGASMLSLNSFRQPGPGLWPFLTAAFLTLTGVILLFVDRAEDYEAWTAKSLQSALGAAALVVFVGLFQLIGFTISGFLLILFWLRWYERASWVRSLVIAAVAVAVLQVLFAKAFDVPFPHDVLVDGLGLA